MNAGDDILTYPGDSIIAKTINDINHLLNSKTLKLLLKLLNLSNR